jgi:hypothetical protein
VKARLARCYLAERSSAAVMCNVFQRAGNNALPKNLTNVGFGVPVPLRNPGADSDGWSVQCHAPGVRETLINEFAASASDESVCNRQNVERILLR